MTGMAYEMIYNPCRYRFLILSTEYNGLTEGTDLNNLTDTIPKRDSIRLNKLSIHFYK